MRMSAGENGASGVAGPTEPEPPLSRCVPIGAIGVDDSGRDVVDAAGVLLRLAELLLATVLTLDPTVFPTDVGPVPSSPFGPGEAGERPDKPGGMGGKEKPAPSDVCELWDEIVYIEERLLGLLEVKEAGDVGFKEVEVLPSAWGFESVDGFLIDCREERPACAPIGGGPWPSEEGIRFD